MTFLPQRFLLSCLVISSNYLLFPVLSRGIVHKPPNVEKLTDRFLPTPIAGKMLTFFGAPNIRMKSNGSYADIILDTTSGSGLVSKQKYFHGFFSAAIRLPMGITSGVVLAFYMSNSDVCPHNHDEIDFELLGHENRKEWVLQTNIYGNGNVKIGREEKFYLWFDPTQDFHQYSILWNTHHIIYLVDNIPIREVINNQASSSVYPLKPMSLYVTIWDGSEWATHGGKYPVNYQYAPFVASLGELEVDGGLTQPTNASTIGSCSKNVTHSSVDPLEGDEYTKLTKQQIVGLNWARTKRMFYSYCKDTSRYKVVPSEFCMANEDGEPTYLKVDINMRGTFVRHPHGYLGERKYPVGYCSSARTLFIGSESARTRLGHGMAEDFGRWCRDVRETFDRTPGLHGYCLVVAILFCPSNADEALRRTLGVHGCCRATVVAILFCPSNAEVSWSLPSMCPGIAEQAFRRTPGVHGSRTLDSGYGLDLLGWASVTDMDFPALDFEGFVAFLERFTGETFEKLYYSQRNRPFKTGIRYIEDDVDYAMFLDTGFEAPEVPIFIYLHHSGDGLAELFDSESDGSGHVTNGEESEKDPEGGLPEEDQFPDAIRYSAGLEDEIIHDETVDAKLNKTNGDEFLSKLCLVGGYVKDMDSITDGNLGSLFPKFNPNVNWRLQSPVLGMRFENPQQMKEMLCNYAVANGYQLRYQKNDSSRLLVICCKGACKFRLWATWMSIEHSFQIKSLIPDHQCSRNFKLGAIVNFQWIGSHYTKDILHRQKLTIRQLRLEVIKKFDIDVSLSQCRRAKKHAMTLIEGTLVEHYAKLWSYGAEIRRSNPGSTVSMDVNPMPDDTNYFSKLYVCFDGVKKGWKQGCRRVIGIDGCFLKEIISGELLCAVGKDANNQIYPICWAVVCVENKDNWMWFLDLMIDDLDLGMGQGLTLMSDQHKGLIEAVKEILPNDEHRQCARHIVANFSKRFRGVHFENLFWKACNATTEPTFKLVMNEIEALSKMAYKYLMDKDPKTWSRAFYQTGRCCANVENGSMDSRRTTSSRSLFSGGLHRCYQRLVQRVPPANRDSDEQPSSSLVSRASEFDHQHPSSCCLLPEKTIADSLLFFDFPASLW
ncbi:hypothetical protein LXL04_011567 [Taraxacum kok-saghyz]